MPAEGTAASALRGLTGRIYVACPKACFWSARYERIVSGLRLRLPAADLREPRLMFSSDNDWRRRWPGVLASIDALVVFGSPTRAHDLQVVGHGVAAEVANALAAKVPVYGLGELGQPIGPMPVGVELRLLPDPRPAEWALLNFSGGVR